MTLTIRWDRGSKITLWTTVAQSMARMMAVLRLGKAFSGRKKITSSQLAEKRYCQKNGE